MDEFVGLRREVERLRAENARLSRLLELRGQDTSPVPEQLSASVAAPGLVTMASPVGDKLALFADWFRARVDVYAVRWENARTGAAGWMPAVAGGWRKGMDRRGVAYLPRTPEVVAAHLVGDVFMGLYPLLSSNTCQFVVADFDGPTAMQQIEQISGSSRRPPTAVLIFATQGSAIARPAIAASTRRAISAPLGEDSMGQPRPRETAERAGRQARRAAPDR
ncbi:hypothetical protein [Micromonospora sp. U21]|uniref:TOTE conflict system archaeo-eukaryotic primase domain-containing protein n=1 Tax=Micromonospora sp. U21 TaxID=2824899 RepID=UPI001FFC2AA7|nr:hypothetical protein [Micromonospora sp. U21]